LKQKPVLKIFPDKNLLAEALKTEIQEILKRTPSKSINIALAGGSTPRTIYLKWATIQDNSLRSNAHFFWGDERCVPPGDEDSNYKMAYDSFLSTIQISSSKIHRIKGEENPAEEVIRYEKEIYKTVPVNKHEIPQFDWILLGMGTDGHTASIFPDSELMLEKEKILGVAYHPTTGQIRISFSFNLINSAKRVTFLVTGPEKAKILSEIINGEPDSGKYPAALVNPEEGILEFYIDEQASVNIKR
jgi:6-phosphogluconolactonase